MWIINKEIAERIANIIDENRKLKENGMKNVIEELYLVRNYLVNGTEGTDLWNLYSKKEDAFRWIWLSWDYEKRMGAIKEVKKKPRRIPRKLKFGEQYETEWLQSTPDGKDTIKCKFVCQRVY